MRYHQFFKTAICVWLLWAQALFIQLPCYADSPAELAVSQEKPPAPVSPENSKFGQQSIVVDKPAEASSLKQTIAALSKSGKLPKIGLALGGGGTRGAAHIGVLRVLEEEGVPIDCIAGTSIGAVIGGLYCAGASLDQIEQMVAKKSLKKAYFTVPLWMRAALVPFFLVPAVVRPRYDGLYRGNKFARFLNKSVSQTNQNIENLKIPFCAVASSLLDGQAHAIKTGNLGKALQASSAIPVLRRPVEIDNDLYVDGGIINNLPVDEARTMGAGIVIAVNVDQRMGGSDLKRFKKIGRVGNRVINMILCRVDSDQLKTADVLIHPDVDNIELLSLDRQDAYEAIEAGRKATMEKLEELHETIVSRSTARGVESSPQ